MRIYTIGFTKKSAREFFTLPREARVRSLIDVRLNNVSQLAGFAKRNDLEYFAEALCGISYLHLPELAPTQEMLDTFKKGKGDWKVYERDFLELMRSRSIESTLQREVLDGGCLLCSEEKPHHCHRRLVAEYLRDKWEGTEIVHPG